MQMTTTGTGMSLATTATPRNERWMAQWMAIELWRAILPTSVAWRSVCRQINSIWKVGLSRKKPFHLLLKNILLKILVPSSIPSFWVRFLYFLGSHPQFFKLNLHGDGLNHHFWLVNHLKSQFLLLKCQDHPLCWLVVWKIFVWLSMKSWEFHLIPTDELIFFIFFRGVGQLNHQPAMFVAQITISRWETCHFSIGTSSCKVTSWRTAPKPSPGAARSGVRVSQLVPIGAMWLGSTRISLAQWLGIY